uniref:Uncharacterized protein n=1 Tax=Oryza meridionalis TaxID=40149 RepID=A0A0E0D338_9ORYZ
MWESLGVKSNRPPVSSPNRFLGCKTAEARERGTVEWECGTESAPYGGCARCCCPRDWLTARPVAQNGGAGPLGFATDQSSKILIGVGAEARERGTAEWECGTESAPYGGCARCCCPRDWLTARPVAQNGGAGPRPKRSRSTKLRHRAGPMGLRCRFPNARGRTLLRITIARDRTETEARERGTAEWECGTESAPYGGCARCCCPRDWLTARPVAQNGGAGPRPKRSRSTKLRHRAGPMGLRCRFPNARGRTLLRITIARDRTESYFVLWLHVTYSATNKGESDSL